MKAFLALSLATLLIAQVFAELEGPSESQVKEFKALISEWSATAQRIIRSLKSVPSEDAAHVSAQLQDTLAGARQRRSAEESSGSDGLQNLFANVNEGLKSLMNNVTSSPLYQQMAKVGESLQEQGKDLVGKLQEQVKNLQNQQPAQS